MSSPRVDPVVFHVTGDLPHAPAEQPVERVDQLNVRSGVGRLAPRHAGRTDFRVNELRLQIATGNIQADHAALSQALVVRARSSPGTPASCACAVHPVSVSLYMALSALAL